MFQPLICKPPLIRRLFKKKNTICLNSIKTRTLLTTKISLSSIKMVRASIKRLRFHHLSGSGLQPKRYGTDFIITDGTTGAQPSMDLLLRGGPGIMVTGITMDGSSSMNLNLGIDSRHMNGLNMEKISKLTQINLEAKRFVDHS